jgi:lipoprotein-anchoring transpeptidase ErfK/SrfK
MPKATRKVALTVVVGLLPVVLGLDAAAMSLGWLSANSSSTAEAADVSSTHPPAKALVLNADRGKVRWDKPLIVDVLGGTIKSVSVTSNGRAVPGRLDSMMWISSQTLVPLQRYAVTIAYADEHNNARTAKLAVQAQDSKNHQQVTVSPDGGTFGVGQPVAVYFSHSVPDSLRSKVISRLSVSTSPSVAGAWHWMSSREVHWRPPTYWQPGTHISVSADVSGLNFGDGYWGGKARSGAFDIGDSHVSLVDVAKHTMVVKDNGKVVKTMPISAGRDKYPTKSGVHIALSKAQVVTMDSATVGIPRNSPDGYYEKVYWDVRISDGGAFVHAAPWSVGSQGRRNVSHGCVNVSTANAEWFYNFSRRGDVVDIVNSGTGPDMWDPGMSDWNMSWSKWTGEG